jgi:Zn-finger nucleic acid-binding protein/uncharacterized protein YxjI
VTTFACVKCDGNLAPFQPKPGVQIGMCRKCKGLWFPRGMLAKQLQAHEDAVRGHAAPGARGTSYKCITCSGTQLIEHPFAGDSRLMVDTCPSCEGMFLDNNELPKAVEIAKGLRRTAPPRSRSAALVGSRAAAPQTRPESSPPTADIPPRRGFDQRGDLSEVVGTAGELYVRQRKEWIEIFTNWEMRNKYDVHDAAGRQIAHVAEHGTGFGQWIARLFLKTHRPFEAFVWNVERQQAMRFQRPFYWFFSDLTVATASGRPLGSVHRRFAWLTTRYELRDETGRTFGWVNQPFWRIWRFPILDQVGQQVGEITKRWGGALREMFTSADAFQIQFGGKPWRIQERAVLLATAITIDLDRFETQSKGGGGNLDFGGDLVSALFD